MAPKEHANLLSIFFWVFAGIQAFMALFIGIYFAIMGLTTAMMMFESRRVGGEVWVVGLIVGIMGILLIFGLVSIYINFLAGKRLRSDRLASKKLIMTASILSILSFLCGGIMVLPFGVALGIYGIWFATSNVGYAYFNNLPINQPQNYLYPPNPPNWQ